MHHQIRYILLTLFGLTLIQTISAQPIRLSGIVVEAGNPKNLITGATIYESSQAAATTSDANGRFELQLNPAYPLVIRVQLVGYSSDSLVIKSEQEALKFIRFTLRTSTLLKTVEIKSRQAPTQSSTLNPINVQRITKLEIERAACCNLSESFTTTASVDVNASDAVSGAKKLQLLGLDGVYAQVLNENLPFLRGLTSNFGLSYIPGSWIESIQITKGTGSVVNGFESLTGQLNLDLQKPSAENPRLFANAYQNHQGRSELNVHLNQADSVAQSLWLIHGSSQWLKQDHNHDGFLDMPLYKQGQLLNRWTFAPKGKLQPQLAARVLWENRQGGATGFNPEQDKLTTNNYGALLNTRMAELYGKLGYVTNNAWLQSAGIQFWSRIQELEGTYGLSQYIGNERGIYLNTIFQSQTFANKHVIKAGLNAQYNRFNEQLNVWRFPTEDNSAGLFAEYTYTLSNFSAVLGIRTDYLNNYGFFTTPRTHLKWNVNPRLTLRASGGKGVRRSHPIAENLSLLASSRQVIQETTQTTEVAWNYGGGFQYLLERDAYSIGIDADYFQTRFNRQMMVDLEDPNYILLYQLKGASISDAFQSDVTLNVKSFLSLRVAYRFTQVFAQMETGYLEKLYVPKNRLLTTASLKTKNERWQLDFTGQWYGSRRLPKIIDAYSASHGTESLKKLKSPAYWLFNTQVSFKPSMKWSWYAGVENIMDYRQELAIVNVDNPFSKGFDATRLWAPLDGRQVYAGVRFNLY